MGEGLIIANRVVVVRSRGEVFEYLPLPRIILSASQLTLLMDGLSLLLHTALRQHGLNKEIS